MLNGYKKREEYINKLPVAKVNYWQFFIQTLMEKGIKHFIPLLLHISFAS